MTITPEIIDQKELDTFVLDHLDFEIECQHPGHYQSHQAHFHGGAAAWLLIPGRSCNNCGRTGETRFVCDTYKSSLERLGLSRCLDCKTMLIPTSRFIPIY